MGCITYTERRFSASSKSLIDTANEIIEEYASQGYDLTLRQLYYQMVARDIIPNDLQSYKRLGSIINDTRLAGLIDWDRIQDLTRELRSLSHWSSPQEIMSTVGKQYRIDKWADQPYRVEVWVEKDALRNVVERACNSMDVPYFVCRGYTSQSEMHSAAMRIVEHTNSGQGVLVVHLGDHDPSGVDMTRDIQDRLQLFGAEIELRRIALNMDQVRRFRPPPNPAKITDSRAAGYIARHGENSWELDALNPDTLSNLITNEIESVRDDGLWTEAEGREATERQQLADASDRWQSIVKFMNKSK